MTFKILFFTVTVIFIIGGLVLALIYRLNEDKDNS
ncbi:uncharacterized protein METZ01_LOCUS63241 [marine metagenome]|jgi:hypothetical protein|uniref:Uncharacterized protein n=1 Tax=marine metagenome TaxID=408172 RepID=A0A381T6T7_9ZZZZ